MTVTSLRDGYVDMPVRRLRQPGDIAFGDDLPSQVSLVDGALRLSVNAFAIDDGNDITLIDTGSSNAWHSTMGHLPEALREAKIATGRIRTVAFTHTHLDHIHGLILADGGDGFPQLSRLLVRELNSTCSGKWRGWNASTTEHSPSTPDSVWARTSRPSPPPAMKSGTRAFA